MVRRIPQPVTDPPIYLDPGIDICFIREDKRGTFSAQNRLLSTILGNGTTTPTWNLSGLRHLFIDYWVMAPAWQNLAPLRNLRGINLLWIPMTACGPRSAAGPEKQYKTAPYNASRSSADINFVGSSDNAIRGAVEGFWGIVGPGQDVMTQEVADTINFNVFAEMAVQRQMDPVWVVPEYELVTYDVKRE